MKFPTNDVIVLVTRASTDVSSVATFTKFVFKRSFKLVVFDEVKLVPALCRAWSGVCIGEVASGVLAEVSILLERSELECKDSLCYAHR